MMKPFVLPIDFNVLTCPHDDGCSKCKVRFIQAHPGDWCEEQKSHKWGSWQYYNSTSETRTCILCRFVELRPQTHQHVFRGRARMVPKNAILLSYGCTCGVRAIKANPKPFVLEDIDGSPCFMYRKGEDLARKGVWVQFDDHKIYLRCPVKLCRSINEVTRHYCDTSGDRTHDCIVCSKCEAHFWAVFGR